MKTDKRSTAAPAEGQIVFVQGGVAEYRNGFYYTGMEDPRWQRPIQWEVTWWHPIDRDPTAHAKAKIQDYACELAYYYAEREKWRKAPAALMLIAAFKGKCLLGPMSNVDCEKAYREGSNAAYEACAEIAIAALESTHAS